MGVIFLILSKNPDPVLVVSIDDEYAVVGIDEEEYSDAEFMLSMYI